MKDWQFNYLIGMLWAIMGASFKEDMFVHGIFTTLAVMNYLLALFILWKSKC